MVEDMREVLRDHDPTATGGILICSRPGLQHGDKSMALEGDIATCFACRSQGPVFNDCFPNFDCDGKQVLVRGARVHCRCTDKPLVLPTQNNFTVAVNRNGESRSLAQADHYAISLGDDEEIIHQYIEVMNMQTGEPVRNLRCDIYVNGDKVAEREPMAAGRSRAVAGNCQISVILHNEENE
ncbi:PAAR domain-containing protein [Cupriavidus oxalaticus]|uniref:PAAR domain-containing protein n=1 Tax=Cupriavidus oxalaticus TaxID=96344 RepID=UPI003F73AA73